MPTGYKTRHEFIKAIRLIDKNRVRCTVDFFETRVRNLIKIIAVRQITDEQLDLLL